MNRMIASFTLLLGSLVLAGPAHADAKSDLKAAYSKFIQATSFRASMTDLESGKTVNTIEFVAPDRFAITMDGGMRQVIIGRTMHMNMGGRTMSIPLPAQVDPAQYRNQKALDQLAAGVVVTQQADEDVDGQAARVYHFISDADGKPIDSLTYVSKATGMPIQIRTTGGQGKNKGKYRYQIRYRDFNDPKIVITAPK